MSKKTEKKASRKKVGKKPLSERNKKVVKGVLKGKPISRAMIDAGYAATTANSKCAEKARELAPTIQALMERRGLTDDRLLDVLDDGLRADKCISCNVIAPGGDGMADAHSATKDFIDVPDHPTRHKFLDTALKLRRHLDKPDDQQGVTIIINAERHD